MSQKGFGHVLILLGFVLIVGLTGIIYFTFAKNFKFQAENTVIAADQSPKQPEQADPLQSPEESPKPDETPQPSPSPIILWKTYTNTDYHFSFTYPAVLTVQNDSEEAYFNRFGGNARENFTSYVKYEPGKVLLAVSVLSRDASFDNSLFTIWVFDNPNNLTIDSWFGKYWYYPFLWGVFDRGSKSHIELDQEASIAGQVTKYKKVDYQQGSPKYIYLTKNNRMFLIRILSTSEHTADDILESLRID